VISPEAQARFWGRVDNPGPDDCWEWQGTRQSYGHGLLSVAGKNLKAHRISYEIHVGPIPAGLIIRHRCDNPPCVNPAHLEVGTRQDNVHDRDSRGRHWALSGEEHNMARLTWADVDEIRSLAARGESKTGLARRFGISRTHVYRIVLNKSWAA
jgi:hypothetical protein